jgi:2,4-dienoyl-CoA reductase-like NADH-dependent reductase (Old Yellow Enzyme family)
MAETPLQQAPRFLSLPFANTPIIADGQHVGFTVGMTLTHEAETVTESVEVICGPEQAAALSTAPIADFTSWSRQAIIDHDLVAKANAAMDAKLAAIAAN